MPGRVLGCVAARVRAPHTERSEFYCIAGRGSGKSRACAVLACYYASHEYHRAPGEQIYVGIFGPDRNQAAITFKYVTGLLKSVPSASSARRR